MAPKFFVIFLTLATLKYIISTKSSPDLTSPLSNELLNYSDISKDWTKPLSLEAWPAKKTVVLSSFLELMQNSGSNITIVTWQRVLKGNKIQNLNSIRIMIPPKPGVAWRIPPKEEAEEKEGGKIVAHAKINQVKKKLAQAEKLGLTVSASLEEFSEDGTRELLIYMNKEELFVKQRGHIATYNKTATITQQEVFDFIENLKPTILGGPTVLEYDTDGNLLSDQSKFQSPILGRVTDNYETPNDISLAAPKILARISQQYRKEKIPRQLAIEFNLAFPEYTWRVLVDPVYYHVRRDVALTLIYDFGIDPNSNTSYFIYGIRNE